MAETTPRRKLAAILAADVVGFSKMMGENEDQTLQNLKACRALTDKAIEKFLINSGVTRDQITFHLPGSRLNVQLNPGSSNLFQKSVVNICDGFAIFYDPDRRIGFRCRKLLIAFKSHADTVLPHFNSFGLD